MTTPYCPETATATANGTTTSGYIESASKVGGWDWKIALFNNMAIEERIQYLLLDQRRGAARFRAEWRAAMGITPRATPRILMCGDSITAGLGSSDGVGYPGWMADLLDRQNIRPTLSYLAAPNWNISNLAAGMATALATNPDVVTIHIGTNDAGGNLANYQAAYTALIQQILATPSVKTVVCVLIPIAMHMPAAYQAGAQQINTTVTAIVNGMATPRVVLADCTAAHMATWNLHPGFERTPPGRWTLDGMHPLDAACLKTAEAILAAAAPTLGGYQP